MKLKLEEDILSFYVEAIELLHECNVKFMLGGAFALFYHTGIHRYTKDLDVFCKPVDYPKILRHFDQRGFKTEITDSRWLAKIFKGDQFIDLIFNTPNNICMVDDSWFHYATVTEFADTSIAVLSAEDLIWCKIYIQNRERFDGADVNHIILKNGKGMDWERLLKRLDQHWQLLLSQLVIFQFVYPADYRGIIPQWLVDELLSRFRQQEELPVPINKVCRGPLIDQTQYSVDIKEWDYKSHTMKTV